MDKWELDFLKEIIRLDTNSVEQKNYVECTEIISSYCQEADLDVTIFDPQSEGKFQPNIVALLNIGAPQTVLLCTHYDVVPAGDIKEWTYPPFDLTIKDERVYGRGVADDKGSIVAAVSAAKELVTRGTSKVNLKILISPNEEIGGVCGIDYLINGPPKIRGDFAIVVDSSPEYVSIGASGVIGGTVTVHGKQGHAGYPFAATNAIHLSIPFLTALMDFVDIRRKVTSSLPSPPGSPFTTLWGRFSITMFHAGSKTNIIPGSAEISFDCRLIPEENTDDVTKQIENFIHQVAEECGVEVDVSFSVKASGWSSSPEHPYTKRFLSTVQEVIEPTIVAAADLGGNDGHFFTKVGIPTVCYGTIADDSNFHGVDEFLRTTDFEKVKNVLIKFAESWV